MKLPFVSRGTFELIRDELAKAEARELAWVTRFDALTARFADATKKPDVPVIPEKRTRDEVIEAIMNRSGTSGPIRTALSNFAMQQRRLKVPDQEIIERILVWAEPGDDDPSAGIP